MRKVPGLFATTVIVLIAVCMFVPSLRAERPGQATQLSPSASRQDEALALAKKEIVELSLRLSTLEDSIKKLWESVLQQDLDLMTLRNRNRTVWLDATNLKQYQRIDSDQGVFLVSLQDIAAYLDGCRVSLEIGNLTSARYVGFRVNATWGPRFDRDSYNEVQYQRWARERQSREFSFTDELRPGIWNKVDLILPTTSADRLGLIAITITTNTVSLGIGK